MNRTLAAVLAFAVWSGLMFGAGWAWRGDRAEGAQAEQAATTAGKALDQVQDTRATEHKQAAALADIGAQHEEDRRDAETVPDAVVAELRAGTLRLRHDLATCETNRLSSAVAGAVERDAGAQLRAEVAAELVRVGRDADDHLRACQAVILADRQP